jgi:threonine dehydratase
MPGELTFPINSRLLAGGFAVSDEMVIAAAAFAWRELKLVVEPSGAVALAAALHGVCDCANKTVAVVLSGGNVDPDIYRRVLETA